MNRDFVSLLPPEIVVLILSFLDPPALATCSLVSKKWKAFADLEEPWRVISLRNSYSLPGELKPDGPLARFSSSTLTRYYDDCTSFRAICGKRWQLERTWRGTDQPTNQAFRPSQKLLRLRPTKRRLAAAGPSEDVWRLKLDPAERTVLSTGIDGGVRVMDYETEEILWEIPKTQTRRSPHLEFSQGWMIFDRGGLGHFEVWRSERLIQDLGRPPRRGHYQMYTILNSPRSIRAYRFQFPMLAAATLDGGVLFFDVPRKEVVQTIDISQSAHRDANVNYIDFDDEYVFLVGTGAKCVTVFSRETGEMVWSLGSHFEQGKQAPVTWKPDEVVPGETKAPFYLKSLSKTQPSPWCAGPNRMNLAQRTLTPIQVWTAIHPDLKTNTLLVLGQGNLLLLRDYKQFFKDTSKRPDHFSDFYFRRIEGILDDDDEIDTGGALGMLDLFGWQAQPDAQLTVADGKAFLVNGWPILIDLEHEGPPPAEREREMEGERAGEGNSRSGDSDSISYTGTSTESEEEESGESISETDSSRRLNGAPSNLGKASGDVTTSGSSRVSTEKREEGAKIVDSSPFTVYENVGKAIVTFFPGGAWTSSLYGCSCAQMDETGLYYVENYQAEDQEVVEVSCFDFTVPDPMIPTSDSEEGKETWRRKGREADEEQEEDPPFHAAETSRQDWERLASSWD
ncbi:hypothetical protein IE53DRAFT_387168 [Violaceomyces palustris]|uniref:Uncharacterized protein n=1 Tax=Violaceomyces palustris TaxID=1673888 RepID=A0ACD0NXB2_9BASI|nr:hypothetical protein IE53DRAFT_387168 [Violaceomyces palustris]